MKRNATKHALLMSTISLLLCVSMLVGTTFAWFTDSVTSANNIIKSGNLDIELEYAVFDDNGTFVEWRDVTGQADILTNNLWEPGVTEIAYLRLHNAGSLALKYQMAINIVTEKPGTNQDDEEFKLSDHILFGVVENVDGETAPFANRDLAVSRIESAKKISAGYSNPGSMLPDSNDLYMALVVYMPTDVGNVANHKTSEDANDANKYRPQIELGINVFATQLESENDSFGPTYDGGASWISAACIDWYLDAEEDATEYVLTSAEDLAGLAAIVNGTATVEMATYATESTPVTIKDDFKGKTIKLGNSIDLNGQAWTPIGDNANPFRGNFDGQNYTVSNLYVSNDGWAGLIGHAGLSSAVTISNLTIDGATILSNRMAGAVVGQLYGNINNCHVKNATITVTPNAVGDSYDNGDKVGGIVGWIGDNGNNRTLTNCTATDVKLGAYRDVGGIAGYVASSTTVSGNSVAGLEITVDQTTNYYGDKDVNAGAICGRVNGTITNTSNTDTNVTINSTYNKNGLTLKSDNSGNVALYRVPESYEGTTVNVPEGVTTIGGYAFAYNTNAETIVLPSTVTTLNDRAFRDTSASKVVLNEGLTNISYQAFRNAENVKEVVIPSTVTTISKEAFQNSGITSLTVPATVTTLEYGACRDMGALETVVIEGAVDIPVYAFRNCPNLKNVVIKNENVTFGGGSARGMIFTNKENGDGSAITVYVANETVKDRLIAADTAAKDYGGYKIVIGTPIIDAASLTAALASGKKEIKLDANIVANESIAIPEGVTLDGDNHTITYVGTDYSYHLVRLNTGSVLKNVTLENYRARTETNTTDTVTLENVVIAMDNDETGLDISRGSGAAKLTNVVCKGTKDATHLDPNTKVQVDYTPYGDVLLGTKWAMEATNCEFGSLHGWNTTNGSSVSLKDTTCTVFRMHYWPGRTLYINGVETAWSESGAIPVAHDVGGCWSVQPAFK